MRAARHRWQAGALFRQTRQRTVTSGQGHRAKAGRGQGMADCQRLPPRQLCEAPKGRAHLPVEGRVLHELLEAPQRPLLHGPILVALAAELAPGRGLGQLQLQEHDQVWLREAHVRLLAPVQVEILAERS